MVKKTLTCFILFAILMLVCLGFTSSKKTITALKNYRVTETTESLVISNWKKETKEESTTFPLLGKSFTGFKEALAFKESGGDYFVINDFGYMGKYQFGKGTLALIGVTNVNDFLRSPELQEKAFIANSQRNKWVLRRDIKRYVGKRINGVVVTESGILAAAHLAGPGHVKRYLRSWGKIGFKDGFGTSIYSYMKRFSGYDTSFIKAIRRARA